RRLRSSPCGALRIRFGDRHVGLGACPEDPSEARDGGVLTVTSGTSKPMRHRRVITALLVCVTAVPVLAASQADSSSPRQRVSKGCPGRFAGPAVRPTSLGSVVAVARLVAIDHITSHYQG